MGTLIKSAGNPSSPPIGTPYIEKDFGVVRGVTKALFDFSHPDCYAGSGPLVGGTTFNNLVAGGAPASVLGASSGSLPAVVTGTVPTKDASNAGGYRYILLPTSFNMSAEARSMLSVLHAKIPAGGYAASALYGIFGSGTGNGTSLQWHVFVQSDASGNALNLVFRVRGSSGNIDATLTGPALAAVLNGAVHQLGFGFDIVGSTGRGIIYVDQAVAVTGGSGAITSFNQAGGTPVLLYAPGVQQFVGVQNLDGRFGRPSIHDLTGRADVTALDLLSRDARSAAGYVY